MRNHFALLTALLCFAAPVSSVHAADTRNWPSYGNSRFNFSACFPPYFHGQGEADNSDGQRFRTADGAEAAVYGNNVGIDETLDELLDFDVTDMGGKGAVTTYLVKKRNVIVASGVGPKGEFYLKRVLRRSQRLYFELTYPARLHAKYSPLIKDLLSCFRIGTEDGI